MFNIDYSKIEFIEVYGLRRSGNHAIIGWFLKNMSTNLVTNTESLVVPQPSIGFISQRCDDVYHINDVGGRWSVGSPKYVRGLIDAYISMGAKTIVLSYEDTTYQASLYGINKKLFYFLEDSKKIIIIRDLANTFASRLMASIKIFGEANFDKAPNPFLITQLVVDKWAINEFFEGTKINYENWLTSKEYRDQISKDLNLVNRDITSEISNAGGGSSFKNTLDKDNLLNRYKQVEFPKEMVDFLKSDYVSKIMIRSYGFDYSDFEFNQIP